MNGTQESTEKWVLVGLEKPKDSELRRVRDETERGFEQQKAS